MKHPQPPYGYRSWLEVCCNLAGHSSENPATKSHGECELRALMALLRAIDRVYRRNAGDLPNEAISAFDRCLSLNLTRRRRQSYVPVDGAAEVRADRARAVAIARRRRR